MLSNSFKKTLNTSIFKGILKQPQTSMQFKVNHLSLLNENLLFNKYINNQYLQIPDIQQKKYFWPNWPNMNNISISKNNSIKKDNLSIRIIESHEIKKCIELQNKLTDKEKGAFSVRSYEEYEQISKQGILLGAFNDRNEMIGQIATDLSTDKKGYISSNNEHIQHLLSESNYVEQGAVIVDQKYRGFGLQSKLITSLLNKIENLIKNEKMLLKKNPILMNKLKTNRTLIVVAGCNAENYSSGINMMKSGMKLIGKVSKTLNEGTKDEVTVNGCIFAKQILSNNEIIYDNSEKTKNKKDELLLLRNELEKYSLENGGKEPYHLDFVKKFTENGFIMSISNTNGTNKYNLELPI